MGPGNPAKAPMPLTPREILYVIIVLPAFVSLQLLLANAIYLVKRNFWLDEIVTQRLVTDSDVMHVVDALTHGIDNSPPTFCWTVHFLSYAFGGTNEVSLRCLTLAFALLALLGIY